MSSSRGPVGAVFVRFRRGSRQSSAWASRRNIFKGGEIFKGGNLKLMARGLTITKHRSVNTLICFKVILIVS